jgi:hypothetical protein
MRKACESGLLKIFIGFHLEGQRQGNIRENRWPIAEKWEVELQLTAKRVAKDKILRYSNIIFYLLRSEGLICFQISLGYAS